MKELRYFRQVKWNPNRAELRRFAIAMPIGFSVLGLLSSWRHGSISKPAMVLWGVGMGLAVTAMIRGLGRIVYLTVLVPSSFIGYFVSKVVLFMVFFLVFVPTGVLLRLMGKDLLRLRPKAPRAVWVPTNSVKDSDRRGFDVMRMRGVA